MAKIHPFALRQLCHQIALNFHRVFFFRQPKPVREAADVGVDDHAGGDSKRRAQHDIGGFASDARQFNQFVQRFWHLAFDIVPPGRGKFPECFWLWREKSRCSERLFPIPLAWPTRKRPHVGYFLNSAGVTILTRTSVHCADKMVAISNCSGLENFSAHVASGYSAANSLTTFAAACFACVPLAITILSFPCAEPM